LPETWQRLSAEVTRWSGESSIISQEFLCWASEAQVEQMVSSFGRRPVHVVLTVRDVARLVPAQWQTAMRQRNTWTLDEYADAVAGVEQGKRAKQAAKHFWRRQDYGPILERFVAAVGLDHVRVVTLPPSGTDPNELWRRFCSACGLDPDGTEPGEVSHESLGAASAELMRRLNAHPQVEAMPLRTYQQSINGALTRRVLGPRRSQEPSLTLPARHREWAAREAERLIADIDAVGVDVIGDLDDLRPRESSKEPVAPELLSPDLLLEAALDGLAGLAQEHAELQRKIRKGDGSAKTRRQSLTEPARAGGLSGLRDTWRRRRPRPRGGA
jgi:hypothetical protein